MSGLRELLQAVVDAPDGSQAWRDAMDDLRDRLGAFVDVVGARAILDLLGKLEANAMPHLEAAYAQGYAKALADKAAAAEKETAA